MRRGRMALLGVLSVIGALLAASVASAAVMPPQLTGTTPGSPGNTVTPYIKGNYGQSGQDLVHTMTFYPSTDCTGTPIGSQTIQETFQNPFTFAVQVTVPANATTPISATETINGETSVCSNALNYTEAPISTPTDIGTDPVGQGRTQFHITGNIPVGGTQPTQINVYASSDCTGAAVAVDSVHAGDRTFRAEASAPGSSTTTFSVEAATQYGKSGCSAPVSYTNTTAGPPATPTNLRTDPPSPSTQTSFTFFADIDNRTDEVVVTIYGAQVFPPSDSRTISAQDFRENGTLITTSAGRSVHITVAAVNEEGWSGIESTDYYTYPPAPTITRSDPPSGDRATVLSLIGTGQGTISIFDNATCQGTPVASGGGSTFATSGISVFVPLGSTTMFSARSTNNLLDSPCSAPFTYVEGTPPPGTKIKDSKIDSKKRTAKFTFGYVDARAETWECKLDAQPFKLCGSDADADLQETYKNLSIGNHKFSVRSVDAAGRPDPSPATESFKIRRQ